MSLRRPCADCPFRKDAPRDGWLPERIRNLYRTASGDHVNIFDCHRAAARARACAGWMAVVGERAPGLRLLVLSGDERLQVDTSELVLFGSFEEMVAAHRLDLGFVGPCCACRRRDSHLELREVLRRLPEGKKGWRCIECGVEQGALAVLCRDCTEKVPIWVCEEDPAAEARRLATTLEPLQHQEGCAVGMEMR